MAAMRTGFGAGRTGAIDAPADEGYSAPYRLWKFPSLAKEGWRAAPGWFDRGDSTTPIGALYLRRDALKTQAADTLAAMGLSLSDAVRVFLTRVVAEQRLPFELKAPNAETRAALAEAQAIISARRARFTNAKALFDALDQETGPR